MRDAIHFNSWYVQNILIVFLQSHHKYERTRRWNELLQKCWCVSQFVSWPYDIRSNEAVCTIQVGYLSTTATFFRIFSLTFCLMHANSVDLNAWNLIVVHKMFAHTLILNVLPLFPFDVFDFWCLNKESLLKLSALLTVTMNGFSDRIESVLDDPSRG